MDDAPVEGEIILGGWVNGGSDDDPIFVWEVATGWWEGDFGGWSNEGSETDPTWVWKVPAGGWHGRWVEDIDRAGDFLPLIFDPVAWAYPGEAPEWVEPPGKVMAKEPHSFETWEDAQQARVAGMAATPPRPESDSPTGSEGLDS